MPLSKAEINRLLALPSRRGGGKKAGIDTSSRDYQTWFKLGTKMVDENSQELILCANPDCQDPRALAGAGQGIVVAEVNGQYMCRYCFLSGWLLVSEDQLTL